MSSSDKDRMRRRLTEFYQKYNPNEVHKVEAAMNAGLDEDELFAKLYEKYKLGPDGKPRAGSSVPQVSQSDSVSSGNDKDRMRRRLTEFYQKYNPNEVHKVEAAMNAGLDEDELFAKLYEKYKLGPDGKPRAVPQVSQSDSVSSGNDKDRMRRRLTEFYQKYNPNEVHKVEAAMNAGLDEDELFAKLYEKYKLGPDGRPKDSGDETPPSQGGDKDSNSTADKGEVRQHEPMSATDRRKLLTQFKSNAAKKAPLDPIRAPFGYADVDPEAQWIFPSLKQCAVFFFSLTHLVKYPQEELLQCTGLDRSEQWDALQQRKLAQAQKTDWTIEFSISSLSKEGGQQNPSAHSDSSYVFLTATHIYVAATDRVFFRCIPFQMVQNVYINSKRAEKDSKCALLFKVYPAEHDLFLVFNEDYSAKRMLWVFLELVRKFYDGTDFSTRLSVLPISKFSAVDQDIQLVPPDNYRTPYVPVMSMDEFEEKEKGINTSYSSATDEGAMKSQDMSNVGVTSSHSFVLWPTEQQSLSQSHKKRRNLLADGDAVDYDDEIMYGSPPKTHFIYRNACTNPKDIVVADLVRKYMQHHPTSSSPSRQPPGDSTSVDGVFLPKEEEEGQSIDNISTIPHEDADTVNTTRPLQGNKITQSSSNASESLFGPVGLRPCLKTPPNPFSSVINSSLSVAIYPFQSPFKSSQQPPQISKLSAIPAGFL